ncbi:MAG: RimK/LysX family protein [Kangiellaceae bacterium]|jgi:hypothetical protein|nr:RimK/LysX family protein [Kangiellaceae bacterium]
MTDKPLIGHIESLNLPQLNIKNLPVRVDTGAKTSSLHVDDIRQQVIDGKPHVKFKIHPELHDISNTIECCAPIHDIRRVKSSNGQSEQRYVIESRAELGTTDWDIEITLTDRSEMTYLMLLGRQAIAGNFYVDPSRSFIQSGDDG